LGSTERGTVDIVQVWHQIQNIQNILKCRTLHLYDNILNYAEICTCSFSSNERLL
jgi:hypothetical protein